MHEGKTSTEFTAEISDYMNVLWPPLSRAAGYLLSVECMSDLLLRVDDDRYMKEV